MDMVLGKGNWYMHKESFSGIQASVTMKLEHKCSHIDNNEIEIYCREFENTLYVEVEGNMFIANYCPNCGYSIK